MIKKIDEIDELQTQFYEKKEEMKQLSIELSESHLKLERRKKKGIPHVNRSFECLYVRLKMPQFICITLQSLFDACLEFHLYKYELISLLCVCTKKCENF